MRPSAAFLPGLLPVASSLLLLGSGCGDGVTPQLSNFRYEGAAPDSPLVLLLAVDFVDDDGDLGVDLGANRVGQLETFIDQEATGAGALPLTPLFLESGVAPEATEGTLEFVLELAFGDDAPPTGSKFTLGCRATDAARNTSTTQEIRLQIDY